MNQSFFVPDIHLQVFRLPAILAQSFLQHIIACFFRLLSAFDHGFRLPENAAAPYPACFRQTIKSRQPSCLKYLKSEIYASQTYRLAPAFAAAPERKTAQQQSGVSGSLRVLRPFRLPENSFLQNQENWFMVLSLPPALSAASPAKYSLWLSPISEPAIFWCFTVAMPWRIS